MIDASENYLPVPFLFNSLKHHRQSILDFIQNLKEQGTSIEEVSVVLKKVGNSMIDLYFGSLSPEKIGDEIREELIVHNHFFKNDYINFIHETPRKYKIVYLSDGSAWTLLAGRDTVNYVHIHPARGSKFTKRVNAIACKTAIIMKIFFEMELMESDLVSLTNRVRKDFLDASPVKSKLGTRRLKSMLDIL